MADHPEQTRRKIHPGVFEAQEQLWQGRISRREFLRVATLLGAGAATASFLAACGEEEATTGGGEAPSAPEAPPAPEAPSAPEAPPAAPTAVPALGAVKRGGILRCGMQIMGVDHPARFSWTEASNVFRHVFEYLTETDEDNITHPLLLESWEPNADLTVWTLRLRQGIRWTNGEELIADHVVFNFNEWLNPDVGSSILGLWEGYLTPDGIEVVDPYTLRLNLAQPKLDVPENLFHYPALIVHPSFDGDVTSGQNASTGPYLLDEYIVGDRARLVRRTDYWQMGEDGQPLPYLDAIEYLGLGDDQTAYISALQNGDINAIYEPNIDTFQALKGNPDIVIYPRDTAQVRVLRMRVDQEPWTDNRVRLALKKCQDRQKILDLAFLGEGQLGHDFHVAPVMPEFVPVDVPMYDPEGARQLLTEAGYTDGLNASISVGTGWSDIVAYAETLQADAQPGGFNLTLDTMPNQNYWDLWTEVSLGITAWTHRPLAVMVLPLAYTADAAGNPVAWNETRWVDEEFDRLLKQAVATIDIEARKTIMADIERIQMERGPIGIAFWKRVWETVNPAFQGIKAHPTLYHLWREVWYDPARDPHA